MKLKIIFIRPTAFCNHEWERRSRALYFVEPCDLYILSAFLKKHIKNIKIEYIDLIFENADFTHNDINEFKKNFIHTIERKEIDDYDCFAIQCYTTFQYIQSIIIGEILATLYPKNILIIGGRHPTSVPDDFLMEKSPFDFIILGESELVLKKFFNQEKYFKKKKQKKPIILKNDKLIDLEKVPSIPDYKLLFDSYPSASLWRAMLFNSRCCPHNCSFCGHNLKYRYLSFKHFKQRFKILLKELDKYPRIKNHISFCDSSFADNPNFNSIMNYFIKNKVQNNYSFGAWSRIDINASMVEKYNKCNFRIEYGLENINNEILLAMNKTKHPNKYITLAKNTLSKYCKNSEAECRLNILIGFPSENLKKAKETYKFAYLYAKCDNIEIQPSLVKAFPGALLYDKKAFYKRHYGTEIISEWWKGNNPSKDCHPQRISFDYSLKDAITVYKDLYREIYEIQKKYNLPDFMKLFYEYHSIWEKELESLSSLNYKQD